jgi:hypothetical protein
VAQEAKYAHQGPTPALPAVALRYWAMRGESLEPGGCSLCPISACAAATTLAPPPPPPTSGVAVVVAVAALVVGVVRAFCKVEAKEALLDVVAGWTAGVIEGANAVSSSAIRAMTESRLTSG